MGNVENQPVTLVDLDVHSPGAGPIAVEEKSAAIVSNALAVVIDIDHEILGDEDEVLGEQDDLDGLTAEQVEAIRKAGQCGSGPAMA